MSEESKMLQVLMDEYNRVGERIASLEDQFDKLVAIGMAVIAATAVYGLNQGIGETFLVAPFVLIWVITYQSAMMRSIFIRSAYRARIEKKVNEILGQRALIMETELIPKMITWSPQVRLLLVVLAIAMFGLAGLSGWQIFEFYGVWVCCVYAAGLVLSGIVILRSSFPVGDVAFKTDNIMDASFLMDITRQRNTDEDKE